MKILFHTLFLTVQIIVFTHGNQVEDDELLAVNLMFRHGDRTPWKLYTNDPYNNNSTIWNEPLGELTKVGKLQHYKFGTWLRERYENFLSPLYKKEEIHVRSSDYDRCLMSASANIAGLYPPQGNDIWLENFPWQPIPIHTMPLEQDDMIEVENSCPIYLNLLENAEKQVPYFKNLNEKNEKLYEYLTEKSGDSVTNIYDAADIYDILFIENLKNLTLPEWTQNVFPDKMKETYDASFKLSSSTPQLARLFIGRYFETVKEQFLFFSGESSEKTIEKFLVFSGHDNQVFSTLKMLNYPNLHAVPYTSSVFFELRRRKQGGGIYVKFFFKSMEDHADPVEIPGCGYECPLETFVEIISPFSITEEEWKKQCSSAQKLS